MQTDEFREIAIRFFGEVWAAEEQIPVRDPPPYPDIPQDEFRERLAKAQEWMATNNLDACMFFDLAPL